MFIFRLYFGLIKWALVLGMTGHLVSVTQKMAKASYKALNQGQLNLHQLNQSLHKKR